MYLAIPPFLPLSPLCPHFSRFPVKARAYSAKTLRYLPAAESKYSKAARCSEMQREMYLSRTSLNSRAALEFLITTSREIFSGKRGACLPRITSYANPDFTFTEWRQSKLRAIRNKKAARHHPERPIYSARSPLFALYTIYRILSNRRYAANRYIPAGIRHSVCAQENASPCYRWLSYVWNPSYEWCSAL